MVCGKIVHNSYICENEAAYTAAKKCFVSAETNEYAMYLFFKNLLRGSTKYLEGLEEQVSQLDDEVSDGTKNELREKSKLSKTVIETMSSLGLLEGMPEDSQLSIFDF